MSENYWYPFYPILYDRDTTHLSLKQDAVYRRLIDYYMKSRRPLPNNNASLCRIAAMSLISNGEMRSAYESYANAMLLCELAEVVELFTPTEDGFLRSKMCDSILDEQEKREKRRKAAGTKAAITRWNKSGNAKRIPKAKDTQCDTNANTMQKDAIKTVVIKKDKNSLRSSLSKEKPLKIEFDLDKKSFVGIGDDLISLWRKAYPAIVIETEILQAAAWLVANPKNRKSNYERFLTNWLSSEQDRAPRRGNDEGNRSNQKQTKHDRTRHVVAELLESAADNHAMRDEPKPINENDCDFV